MTKKRKVPAAPPMREDIPEPEDNSSGVVRLGGQLREIRTAQGLSYDEVAAATRVRPNILLAIEDGRVHEAAAPVYVRGLVKNYCEYLMADDVWRKYADILPVGDSMAPSSGREEEQVIITQPPTPIFRRSSMIWVYVPLFAALLLAVFLLWKQQITDKSIGDIFPLRIKEEAVAAVSEEPVSQQIVSEDAGLPNTAPPLISRSIAQVSADAVPVPPISGEASARIDLSWMDNASGRAGPPSLNFEATEIPLQTLVIDITGVNNRLNVRRGGRSITRRHLRPGAMRSYDVTGDTEVTFSVGNAANVTWYGKKYERIGDNDSPLKMIFHPDGKVTLLSGNSAHFAAASSDAVR
ncbi:helix-turn-helix domain-containing protein [Synergistales bacterium]|nr:helix-turn-helix domain-containing protein [Synergistales bacterium]